MQALDIRPQVFTINDFLGWQRDKTLVLSPNFQRRPVWRPGAKSYLIDSIVRGLPVPAIMIRERLDLKGKRTYREVVDGQQRLRTLFAYIEPELIPDWDDKRDSFTVQANHNPAIAGKPFSQIGEEIQKRILEYRFSTHILPTSIEDRDILQMFARINSTGVKVNKQELRNAQYFGLFKGAMYQLALEQLDRWRDWGVFTEVQIARMNEVELVSDLALSMLEGLSGKEQARIDGLYKLYDDAFPGKGVFERRFQRIMDEIDQLLGKSIRATAYRSPVVFFSLFTFLYDLMYGLGSDLISTPVNRRLPRTIGANLLRVGREIRDAVVPEEVLDAIQRAPTDLGRRQTRFDFLVAECIE